MRTTKYLLVTADIAQRAGVASVRYRTKDGMMIISEQDIRSVRLEPEEYMTGVVAQVLTEDEASILIADSGKVLGPPLPEQEKTENMEAQQSDGMPEENNDVENNVEQNDKELNHE